MTIGEKINSFSKLEFKKTDKPFDYRYALGDDNIDYVGFCNEAGNLYGYNAEDVFKILKYIITSNGKIDEVEIVNDTGFPLFYISEIMEAIIKLDKYIKIKKRCIG